MNTTLAPTETLAESRRLIATLEQLRGDLPFADELLAAHIPRQHELEQTYARSEQAVAAWRAALARRWECEVAGRRLYKRTLRRLIEQHGGEHAPAVQLLSRGGAEADSTPSELLADLRRLLAAASVAGERQDEIAHSCTALEAAIGNAARCETERRNAVIDHRLASEAYRRTRAETQQRLGAYYGERMPELFAE
ncbi:MAG TPA: hypothetical protein PLO33_14675 [Kouleothrix sp.]|uniref:hypothetical protein n=1 Tax=Kouleothrix sp. TaxID=2779161 RepID=UPI002C88FB11|nr:hypothetical protein [Kouleothrix sp.]HRC76920.1 hypothetical protein [Kouleothrix sp.]